MNIGGYLDKIRKLYASGQTTEHSFRPALVELFQSMDPELAVINEPQRLVEVGAVDFVFNRHGVPIGWCEAKDIGKDVRKFATNDYSKEQKERYRKALPNLIYTNGLDFEFIRDGAAVDFISIADVAPGIQARPQDFGALETRLRDFASTTPLSVTSSKRLAELMAGKAMLIKDIMSRALTNDLRAFKEGLPATDLVGQYDAFKTNLLHDVKPEEFADVYAETIAYGLFAARLHDKTVDSFTRTEALELLPRSNPFLRELFVYVAGPNLDERLRRTIDDLCHVFRATNMEQVIGHFGKATAQRDPFLHFYEVFLAEYNPAKRKARGVWYTPEPVVNFIVRAVDEVLKTEFDLADGLADTSKISIDWDTGQNNPKTGKPITVRKEVHRVQILDPATGTGTFLAEAIKLISGRVKSSAAGQWSNYVENDLIPRFHGFELMMASYAMCHAKLDMILSGLGYKPSASPPRLGVYLTNSLEEGDRVEQTLFGLSRALASEAKAANDIKRQQPIMCVIGNPPYSGISQNNGAWITNLIEDYKYVDGVHFGERKHWLQDDYVKFMRLAEHMIEKNGEGVVGLITNHGYLDNPTFRGMRWHLLKTFDKIWVLNLHGNSKKGTTSPDGSADENVFDIQQGVAIIIACKRRHGGGSVPEVRHKHVYGERSFKNDFLCAQSLPGCDWTTIAPAAPYFMLEPVDHRLVELYEAGPSISSLFQQGTVGFVTAKDSVNISFSSEEAQEKISFLKRASDSEIRHRFSIAATDARDWKVETAKRDAIENGAFERFTRVLYRPFDARFTCYTGNSRGLYASPQHRVMKNLLGVSNMAITASSINRQRSLGYYFITDHIADFHVHDTVGDSTSVFPLYLYSNPRPGHGNTSIAIDRRLNFDPKHYTSFCRAAGIDPSDQAGPNVDFRATTAEARPSEVKVFDYIYGVLHCPAYRETFAEFLKIAFPHVPSPPSPEVFRQVSEIGEQLRRLHLMEAKAIGATPYPFDGEGNSVVDKLVYADGCVYINPTQYFDRVPQVAWEFHIGGYQPAQKWLKDRKGRTLSWEDVRHYQKIIKIVTETDRIMREIVLPLGD